MTGKDYYKILEVPRTASPEEMKKAYRKLAMKYHPDRNKGDKTSESKFKDINEAYAVVSNAEKRKQYDLFGAEGFQKKYTQEDIFRDFDFSGIFREFGFGEDRRTFSVRCSAALGEDILEPEARLMPPPSVDLRREEELRKARTSFMSSP